MWVGHVQTGIQYSGSVHRANCDLYVHSYCLTIGEGEGKSRADVDPPVLIHESQLCEIDGDVGERKTLVDQIWFTWAKRKCATSDPLNIGVHAPL